MKAKRTELQRLLSKRGFASRAQAALLIREGKVRVNGAVVKDPRAYLAIDAEITIDGKTLKGHTKDQLLVLAFHKPKGCVTTRSDEKGRKTVYDLIPEKYRSLKAVGRLDMASTGLLLFTNDNFLADRLLDPKNKIKKEYVVTVKGKASEDIVSVMQKGVTTQGELLKASRVEIRKASGKESILMVTLTEGKNREIRRLCEACGHEVIKLKRISFGNIELGDLPVGGVREVKEPF